MLLNSQAGFKAKRIDLEKLQPIATVEDIIAWREQVQQVKVTDNILDYLLEMIERTRQHPDLSLGASPRSAVAWLQAAKANSWLLERDYVTPDDIKTVAFPLLRHRLILQPEAQLDGVEIEHTISSILKQVAVPR